MGIAMLVTQQDLDSFHHFAQAKLQNGDAASIEELFDLWRINRPTPEDLVTNFAAFLFCTRRRRLPKGRVE